MNKLNCLNQIYKPKVSKLLNLIIKLKNYYNSNQFKKNKFKLSKKKNNC